MDAPLAHLDQRLGAAQHAGRRAAHLHVRLLAHRRELEHRVEGGDLVDADVGHAQHVGDQAHGRLGEPVVVLLLRPPQQRDDGRGLLARRIVGDGRLGPGLVLGREGEAGGLMRDRVCGRTSAVGVRFGSWAPLIGPPELACRLVLERSPRRAERGKVAEAGRQASLGRCGNSGLAQPAQHQQHGRRRERAAGRSAPRRAGSRSRTPPRRRRTPGSPPR